MVKMDQHSFAITGGNRDGNLRDVKKYNIVDNTTKTLRPLLEARSRHGCAMVEKNSKWLIVVTGGKSDQGILQTTEVLVICKLWSYWKEIGKLNVARNGHGMTVTEKGALVMGGVDENRNNLKSVELLDLETLEWQKMEPSLAMARGRYGGGVEIPAGLFDCEIQPIVITG